MLVFMLRVFMLQGLGRASKVRGGKGLKSEGSGI